MRAYIEHHSKVNQVRLCPRAKENISAGGPQVLGGPGGAGMFPECGTIDEAWLWPTNGGWVAPAPGVTTAVMPSLLLYAAAGRPTGRTKKLAYKKETEINFTATTPVLVIQSGSMPGQGRNNVRLSMPTTAGTTAGWDAT